MMRRRQQPRTNTASNTGIARDIPARLYRRDRLRLRGLQLLVWLVQIAGFVDLAWQAGQAKLLLERRLREVRA